MAPHPLDILTIDETNRARDIVAGLHKGSVLSFREIYLEEPPKAQLVEFLAAEHAGKNASPPARTALVQYDVIGSDRIPRYNEDIIDLGSGKSIKHVVVDSKTHHAGLTL